MVGFMSSPSNGTAKSPIPRPLDGAPHPNGRTADGKFAAGNRLAKGNPFHRRLADLRKLFVETVGEDGVRQLAARLLEQSLAGDTLASKLVLEYCLGRPVAVADPDASDLRGWLAVYRWPSL